MERRRDIDKIRWIDRLTNRRIDGGMNIWNMDGEYIKRLRFG